MELRTLTCAAIGFALAGAVISTEFALSDYWVPLGFGIIGLVFGIGACLTANEDGENIALPVIGCVIAAFAIFQGIQGMSDFREINQGVDEIPPELQESTEGLPGLTQ
jgi:hypothetical protein